MQGKLLYKCYIDESGDESLGSAASPWFILSAVIVRAEDERCAMNYEREAIHQIWTSRGQAAPSRIHWRDRPHSQRMRISQIIAPKPYTQIVVGVWKSRLTRPQDGGLGNHSVFYNYACKLMMERISWYVDGNNGWVDIVFSKWGSLQNTELQTYIKGALCKSNSQIRPVFDVSKIEVQPMEKLVMLRFADNCASAFGNALNPDELGNFNYYYADLLYQNLYRYGGRSSPFVYGFKVFPTEVKLTDIVTAYPHIRHWFGV